MSPLLIGECCFLFTMKETNPKIFVTIDSSFIKYLSQEHHRLPSHHRANNFPSKNPKTRLCFPQNQFEKWREVLDLYLSFIAMVDLLVKIKTTGLNQ